MKKLMKLSGLLMMLIASSANAHLVKFTGTEVVKGTNVEINDRVSKQSLGSYNISVKHNGDTNSFVGFCVDPYQFANRQWKPYQVSTLDASDFLNGGASKYTNVQKLFDNAYGSLNGDAHKTAGFHLALWEIFADDTNLGSGNVQTTDSSGWWGWYKPGTNDVIKGYASTFLASLDNWTVQDKYDFNFYKSEQYQDFLEVNKKTPSAVPVPATLPLMASALGLLAIVRRRKANAL